MSVTIKMDETKYREALSQFETELSNLRAHRDRLKTLVDSMTGAKISGSSVQSAIDKAKDAERTVTDAIQRAEKQKAAIEYVLGTAQTTRSTLVSEIKDITFDNLFK